MFNFTKSDKSSSPTPNLFTTLGTPSTGLGLGSKPITSLLGSASTTTSPNVSNTTTTPPIAPKNINTIASSSSSSNPQQVTVQQLAKQLKAINAPVQQSSKQLIRQIQSLNTAMISKIQQCDQLIETNSLKSLDEIYDKAIQLLLHVKTRQQEILKELKKQHTNGMSSAQKLTSLNAKVNQIEMEFKKWMEDMPLVQRIVKIQNQVKKLQQMASAL